MGYYSDVMFITDAENTEIVKEIFAEFAGSGTPSNILEWSDNTEGFEYTHYEPGMWGQPSIERPLIMWEWEGMRWGYRFTRTDEIEKAIEEALTYADTSGPYKGREKYPHYGLIVIGEEHDDLRLEGSPDDYGMSIERTIKW